MGWIGSSHNLNTMIAKINVIFGLILLVPKTLHSEQIISYNSTPARSSEILSSPNLEQEDTNACRFIQMQCNYRSGCGATLQSFVFECDNLLKNRTDQCTDRCKNTLIGLTSTVEGRKLMNCNCNGDFECLNARKRIEACRNDVIYANRLDTVVSCTEAQWICTADAECSKALEYYNLLCKGMFKGKRCNQRCKNSIQILTRQTKAIKLAECRCDAEEKMGNFFCSDIKKNLHSLCDIDLIRSVHDRKVKLIREEKENIRKQEILEKKRAEEQRKLEEETLARMEQEEIERRMQLEMDKENDMGQSNMDILTINTEYKKELIEIKKIEFEKDRIQEYIGGDQGIHVNNQGIYNEDSDVELHMKQVIDHDENYENEDPDDEEDIENEITDEELAAKEKEMTLDDYEDNLISSSAISLSYPIRVLNHPNRKYLYLGNLKLAFSSVIFIMLVSIYSVSNPQFYPTTLKFNL